MGVTGVEVEAAPSTMAAVRHSQPSKACSACHVPAIAALRWLPSHPQHSRQDECSDLARLSRLLLAPRRPLLAMQGHRAASIR